VPRPNPFITEGFVRLHEIIAPHGPLPIGKSAWWAGVKNGRFPRPVKLGARTTAWRVEDIRNLLKTLGDVQ
jgi:prophage regulatory protein